METSLGLSVDDHIRGACGEYAGAAGEREQQYHHGNVDFDGIDVGLLGFREFHDEQNVNHGVT